MPACKQGSSSQALIGQFILLLICWPTLWILSRAGPEMMAILLTDWTLGWKTAQPALYLNYDWVNYFVLLYLNKRKQGEQANWYDTIKSVQMLEPFQDWNHFFFWKPQFGLNNHETLKKNNRFTNLMTKSLRKKRYMLNFDYCWHYFQFAPPK